MFKELSYFEWDGKKYTIAVIGPSLGGAKGSENINKLAEHFNQQSKDFVYQTYSKRYPTLPETFFDKMKAQDRFADGRSSLVVIFDQGNLSQIQATLRFVWRNKDNPTLPSEKMLGISFADDVILFKNYEVFGRAEETLKFKQEPLILPNGSYFEDGKINLEGYVGDSWEIKNFVVNKDAPIDFVPFLFDAAERSGVSYNAPTSKVTAKIGNESLTAQFFPSQYYLTCDQRMVPLYSKLGFSKVQDGPIEGDNYLMKISREQFATDVGNKFDTRPTATAFRNINQYRIDPLAWDIAKYYTGPYDNHVDKLIQTLHPSCNRYLLSNL